MHCTVFSIQLNLSTCLKTGWLNKNTDPSGGWRVSVPFVADLIMFSVHPMLNISVRTRRMCGVHSVFCSAGLTNVWHPGVRIGGINVFTLTQDYFSCSFFVQHAAPVGKSCDSCIAVLKIYPQSILHQ